ncbi:hypothetical protein I4U23_012514 [Adineta vaga]|nr:hypothetical protein I4U23_012514 [Adineta vaga]
MGTQFMPINMDALHLGNISVQTKMKCAIQCHSNHQCRTFNFDTSTQICQLFQGDKFATGTIVPGAQTIVAGSFKWMNTLFDAHGQPCNACKDNRFLRCVNSLCDCQQNTYWDGTVCLPQLPMPCMECEPSKNMCRSDLSLTCQSYNKCDYANKTCNVTDIHTTEPTTEGTTTTATETVYSSSTPSVGSWISVGNMSAARSHHTSVLLSSENDTVLIAGGFSPKIDKFILANKSFMICGQMLNTRAYMTAAEMIPSNIILFVGGEDWNGNAIVSNIAEVFDVNLGAVNSTVKTMNSWSRHSMVFLQASIKMAIDR